MKIKAPPTNMRRLISSVFTPRQVARIQDQVTNQAVRIVDDLLKTTDGDFVEQVTKRLPMWTIYDYCMKQHQA